MTEINAGKMHADKKTCQESKTAEYDFLGDNSSRQECLRANKPENGHVVSGIVERNGGKHQRRADNAEDDKSVTAAFGDGQLGKDEFEHSNGQERQIGELRLDGLKLHDAEQQEDVQESSKGGDVFFEVRLYVACDVGNTKCQPVEEEQSQTGLVFVEVAAVSPFDTEDAVEPIKVIQVAGKNTEDFELEPAHFQDDGDKTDGKNYARDQAVDGVLTQRHGGVTEQKGQAGNELRAISQGVRGHRDGHHKHQDAVESQ